MRIMPGMKKVKSPDVLTDILNDIKIKNSQINLMFFVLCIKHFFWYFCNPFGLSDQFYEIIIFTNTLLKDFHWGMI